MLSAVNSGIQIGALTDLIPSDEPAVQLIEEEQITYSLRLLRRSRSELFPVPASVDGSEHQEVLSVHPRGAGDPSIVGR